MGKRNQPLHEAYLSGLLDSRNYDGLSRYLVLNSNLPGPAANLSLLNSFAGLCAVRSADSSLLQTLYRWADLGEDDAPFGGPEEFLPVCALVSLGALFSSVRPGGRKVIIDHLQRGARDGRWRSREGSAMAFQRIGEWDFDTLRETLTDWLRTACPLEQRCILASLAHPPMLDQKERVRYCLDAAGVILEGVYSMTPGERKTEEYRVLRKGLEYCVSVFVSRCPEEGFPFVEDWLRRDSAEITKILHANLGKARLAKKHGERVEMLLEKYPRP